jgi:hypothetical protein
MIGAAKCASSAVSALLGKHPDIFIVPDDTDFFSRDDVFSRGLAWYESLFDPAGSRASAGEISNTYTMKELFPNAADRIAAYEPGLKLLYLVRDPLARIESFWIELRSHGGETVHHDFNEAVRRNPEWLVHPSNYLSQVDAYRRSYPDERIRVMFYEDFRADPIGFMRRCFAFLDVDPDVPLEDAGHNPNPMEQHRVVSPTLSRLRALPGYQVLKSLVPPSFRRPLRRRLFTRRAGQRPQWSLEARRFVLDVLRDDSRRFLERYGKPRDFWKGLA